MRQVLATAQQFFDSNKHRKVANLVRMELPTTGGSSTSVYLTDYSTNITFQGNLYTTGQLKSISSFTQTTELTSAQINIAVTGLDQYQLGLFLEEGHSLQGKKVTVYQQYLDQNGILIPIMEGNLPYIWFRGNIQGGKIDDKRDATLGESVITWTCTNDFFDFERIQGRYTSDQAHRALVTDETGALVPSGSAKRPEYADDLGFFHANKSTQILAKYQTEEKKYKMESHKKSGLGGLMGMEEYEVVEYYETVTKEVDLSFNLAAKYLPVAYGTQFVGGIPIFADTEVNNPNMVWVVYAVCEGEIEGFLDIHIDDKPLVCIDDEDDQGRVCFGRKKINGDTMNVVAVDAAGNPVPNAAGPSVHGQSYVLQDDDGEIKFWVYHGLKNQTASSVMVDMARQGKFYMQQGTASTPAIGPEYWDQNFKLLDTQYVVMRVAITENRSDIPDVMFEVKGRKIKTYNSQLVPTQTKSSSNLAWQILDYTTQIFGQAIPIDSIDLNSFYFVASSYDIIDTSYDALWVPFWRYVNWENTQQSNRKMIQTNWVMDTASSVFDCLKILLAQGQASLPSFNGKYYLTQQLEQPTVAHIDLENTIGGNISITDSTGRTKYNMVAASISDPAMLWNEEQITFFDSTYLQQDNMMEKQMNLAFPGITNYYTARTMAARELKKSRYSRAIENIKTDGDLFFLLPNDPVTISYNRYNFSEKTFFVNSVSITPQGRVELKLTEFDVGVFISSPQSDNSSNQIPSISSNILPPTNLQYIPHLSVSSDAIAQNGTLEWTASKTTGVIYYTIYQSGKLDPYIVEALPDITVKLQLPIIGLVEGNYTFEVRQVIGSGSRSKPQVLVTDINPAKSLSAITGFRARNRNPGEQSIFSGGYLQLEWDRTPDEDLIQPLYYVLEFYNSTNALMRSLTIQNLYDFTYLLTDMKADYKLITGGSTGVYRKYIIRIRAEGQHGEQSVSWTYLE